MISEATARKMAIRFFEKQGCLKFMETVQWNCVDEVFQDVVRTLGKAKTLELYGKLPKKLKVYTLIHLEGWNDDRLRRRLDRVYGEFDLVMESDTPERFEKFPEWMKKTDEIVLKYLKGGKNK
ncbi:unnamed protein product [marine sediment metagenome]|uniref:Uncharacterized protein n=1 Tax=marine sediment metagenome TaxID=412755 RepID=X1ETJ1_9ZZZZ